MFYLNGVKYFRNSSPDGVQKDSFVMTRLFFVQPREKMDLSKTTITLDFRFLSVSTLRKKSEMLLTHVDNLVMIRLAQLKQRKP
jgi:hypothetical protein